MQQAINHIIYRHANANTHAVQRDVSFVAGYWSMLQYETF